AFIYRVAMIIGLFQMLHDTVFHQSSNQCFLRSEPRNRKDMCSSRLQGSHDFPDCWRDIWQMFEDIGSDNQIKRSIFKSLLHQIFTAKPPMDLASRRVWKEMSRKIRWTFPR